MRDHGLVGWRLAFDHAKTRAGICNFTAREIGLSRVLTGLHTEAEVRDTILHEIAHALVGPEHGHDAIWRAKAIQIGCSGMRCVPETAAAAPGLWRGVCPSGHVFHGHRAPQRVTSCLLCAKSFDLEALISWTWRGRRVPMSRKYQNELARLRGEASSSSLPVQAARAVQLELGF